MKFTAPLLMPLYDWILNNRNSIQSGRFYRVYHPTNLFKEIAVGLDKDGKFTALSDNTMIGKNSSEYLIKGKFNENLEFVPN